MEIHNSTEEALRSIPSIKQLCEYHEQLDTFWVPTSSGSIPEWVASWFSYYGSPALESQWALPEPELTDAYVDQNYPEGEDVSEGQEGAVTRNLEAWQGAINTQPYLYRPPGESTGAAPEISADRIAEGLLRRQKSARLHDYIVSIVAKRLEGAGFTVAHDPQSVDLLAARDATESILEIKTVTPRNIIPRIRLALANWLNTVIGTRSKEAGVQRAFWC